MILSLFAWHFQSVAVSPVVFVAPNNLSNTEGNQSFSPFDSGANSVRFQQVYGASQFAPFLPAGGWISEIWFRPDASPGGGGHGFNTTLQNVQINLSTTQKNPDGLSLTFADNVGLDDTIVVNGALPLESGYYFMTVPQPFQVLVYLPTPFYYNPSSGNLLLDIRNFSGGNTGPLDATDVLGDSVSIVSTGPVNAVTGFAGTG